MKRFAAPLTIILCACQTVPSQPVPLFALARIKADPEGFLARYEGQRIRVSGIYAIDHLAQDCLALVTPQDTYFDLSLTGSTFQQALHRPVVLEAVPRKPHKLELGGGDLVIEVPADSQDVYLTKAKLVSIEKTDAPCPRL